MEYFKLMIVNYWTQAWGKGCVYRKRVDGGKTRIFEFADGDFQWIWDIWNANKDEVKSMGVGVYKETMGWTFYFRFNKITEWIHNHIDELRKIPDFMTTYHYVPNMVKKIYNLQKSVEETQHE